MAALAEHPGLRAGAAGQFIAPLGGVKDWYIVDSTAVTGRDALRGEFPGTGEYAAIKVHKVFSVDCRGPARDHFSPAREHDSRHLTIDESWRGCGLLADLAYASLARLQACNDHGVRLIIRLKDHWKTKFDLMAHREVTQEFFPGTDLDVLLEEEILVRDGRAIDADVHVGKPKHPWHLRLIGVHTAKGDGFFLTNLSPRIGPRQVADRYREDALACLPHRLHDRGAPRPQAQSADAAAAARSPPDQSPATLAALGAAAGGRLPVHRSGL
jgi:Transposase DDE domain